MARWTLAEPTPLAVFVPRQPSRQPRRSQAVGYPEAMAATEDPNLDHDEQHTFLASTPVEILVATELLQLLQAAAIRLAAEPPDLPAAQLAIDIAGAIVGAGGERLGQNVPLYRTALAEVQQVWVKLSTPPTA